MPPQSLFDWSKTDLDPGCFQNLWVNQPMPEEAVGKGSPSTRDILGKKTINKIISEQPR